MRQIGSRERKLGNKNTEEGHEEEGMEEGHEEGGGVLGTNTQSRLDRQTGKI